MPVGRNFTLLLLVCAVVFSCCLICIAAETGEELPFILEICKIDAGTGLPVPGAEFVLSGEDGSYLGTGSGKEPDWVKSKDKATLLVTDSEGLITVEGLLPGPYSLTETKAPNGYILQEAPVKLELSAQYDRDDTGAPVITALSARVNEGEPIQSTPPHDRIRVTVENTYGTVLPATGGVGTSIYYFLGFITLFALSLIIVAKRLVREQ